MNLLRLGVVALLWFCGILIGFGFFQSYMSAPGPAGTQQARYWAMPPGADRPLLIMFAHPRCPCTAASIAELAEIMAQSGDKTTAKVLFVKPRDVPKDWEDTSLRTAAGKIPGLELVCDDQGQEARRLGATTSGHVFLFNPQGRLLFSGGITRGRGQHGDNAGRRAVLKLLAGDKEAQRDTPVFGCLLLAGSEDCGEDHQCK